MTGLRIALLTYSTKPRGGVVHTLNLAEALSRLGAKVDVWSLARGGDARFFRAVDDSVTVQLIPFPDIADETVTDRIVRSIAAMRAAFTPDVYDIVHAQDCISANAAGTCIRTIHHLDQFTTPVLVECHEKAIVNPYARICVSQAVAGEVESIWGLTPTVIPNGVEYRRFSDAASDTPDAVAARDRWRDEFGTFVLAVGGIEPRKGSIDLVQAYAVARQHHPDLTLVFGGGETLFDYRAYRAEFDRVAAELDVRPIVLGALSDADVASLIAACDVFAFPSTKEGFGLAAMEALAAGRPVVTRELPILREVFANTVTYGSDVDSLASALAEALRGASERSEPGRALAKSLTWEAAAKAHLRFYERFAGAGA